MITQISKNDYTDGTSQSAKSSCENRRNHLGQSTIEYLLVTAAVIAAIAFISGQVQSRARGIMSAAINKIPTP